MKRWCAFHTLAISNSGIVLRTFFVWLLVLWGERVDITCLKTSTHFLIAARYYALSTVTGRAMQDTPLLYPKSLPSFQLPILFHGLNSLSTRNKQRSYRVFHPRGSSSPLQSLARSNLMRCMILCYSHPLNGSNNNLRNIKNKSPVAIAHPEGSSPSLQSLAGNNSTQRVAFVCLSPSSDPTDNNPEITTAYWWLGSSLLDLVKLW